MAGVYVMKTYMAGAAYQFSENHRMDFTVAMNIVIRELRKCSLVIRSAREKD